MAVYPKKQKLVEMSSVSAWRTFQTAARIGSTGVSGLLQPFEPLTA